MQIDAGYRVHAMAAVGFHLGAQVVRAPQEQAANSFADQTYIGIEAGVSGSVVLERIILSPWVGLQSLHNKRYRAAGLVGSYGVHTFGHESIAVFASVMINNDWLAADNGPISDIGALAGVGYRSW